jgi:hypothetical protein
MTNEATRCCSACGLPPRENKKLKCCSQCKNVWYHDLECQKRHYPTHKTTCRPISTSSNNKKSSPQQSSIHHSQALVCQPRKLSVERRDGKGSCLVATSFIRKGERIRDTENEFWEPLVPPVLHNDSRSTRCAFCFQKLGAIFYRYEEIKPRYEYLLLFCSSKCRTAGRTKGMVEEELAVGRIYEQGGPPKVFSTAILLYRILVETQVYGAEIRSTKNKLDKLQHKIMNTTSGDTSVSEYHTQAVITTTAAMIQASKEYGLAIPALEEMTAMVHRIKLNGFSICDGESVAMGVGLYGTPSFMNHSCIPNAVQTFLYGSGQPPSLFLTAFEDIQPNNEVCISYVDNTSPRQLRRERLQNDYFFSCNCEACEDREYNSRILGLKCYQCNSEKRTTLLESSLAPAPQVYQCQSCGSTDFQDEFKTLDDLHSCSTTVKDLTKLYDKLKQICWKESWYVQECGDRLVQAFLDMLGDQSNDIQEQQRSAFEALSILEDLLDCNISESPTSNFFRQWIRRYKAAKLRLFLMPDPRKSISDLESARNSLSLYYPEEHELMVGLRECLRDAMS